MISGDFVKLRISGEMMAVERMAERLHSVADVRDDSLNFPNHEGPGVYRYLMVLLQDRVEMSGGRRAPVPLRAVRSIGRRSSGAVGPNVELQAVNRTANSRALLLIEGKEEGK